MLYKRVIRHLYLLPTWTNAVFPWSIVLWHASSCKGRKCKCCALKSWELGCCGDSQKLWLLSKGSRDTKQKHSLETIHVTSSERLFENESKWYQSVREVNACVVMLVCWCGGVSERVRFERTTLFFSLMIWKLLPHFQSLPFSSLFSFSLSRSLLPPSLYHVTVQ